MAFFLETFALVFLAVFSGRLIAQMARLLRKTRTRPSPVVTSSSRDGGGPYRTPTSVKPAATPVSEKKSTLREKYPDLLDPKYDAAYAAWVALEPSGRDTPYLWELIQSDVADPHKARAAHDIIKRNHRHIKITMYPAHLQPLVVDAILEEAENNDNDNAYWLNPMLLDVIRHSPKDTERAVVLLRGWGEIASLIRYSDLSLPLKRRLDARLRDAVTKAAREEGRLRKRAWTDRSKWEYGPVGAYAKIALGCLCEYVSPTPCDMTLRRDQVRFLAEVGAPVFNSYSTFDMLRLHFNGPEDVDLRRRVLSLFVSAMGDSEWTGYDNEILPEWRNELPSEVRQKIDAAIAQGVALQEQNQKWQKEHDAREQAVMDRLRKE